MEKFLFWIWTFTTVIMWLILLPILLLVDIIIVLAWFPGFTGSKQKVTCTLDLKRKREIALEHLDREKYMNDGDGVKFISLIYSGTLLQQDWDNVKRFWQSKTFSRLPDGQGEENVSGDMMSGMWTAIYERESHAGLTESELKNLEDIMDNTFFKYPFYMYKHPSKSGLQSRGWLWRGFEQGADLCSTLATIAICRQLFPHRLEFKILYPIFFLMTLPHHIAPEFSVWVGKYYGVSWFDEHSKSLFARIGYKCTESFIFRRVLKWFKRRYYWNPDIQVMYLDAVDPLDTSSRTMVQDYLSTYDIYIKTGSKPVRPVPYDKWKEYFSIRSFETKKMASCILPMQYNPGGNYKCEQNFLKPEGPKVGCTADFIFLTEMWDRVK